MLNNFTHNIDNSLWNIKNNDYNDALSFLNDPSNFRSFSVGLTMLIQKYGYSGNSDDIEAKTNFILNKLSTIRVTISKSTIKDWFLDKRRPALVSNSRTIMFQLVFALHVSKDDFIWFFSHVYFDRTFNCHTIEEAIYYYCFQHKLPYEHTQELLATATTYSAQVPSISSTIFTQEIQNYITHCTSDEELLYFLKQNIAIFQQWNKSSVHYINKLLSQIRGKASDKLILEALKDNKNILPKEIESCGLIIQEYIFLYKQTGYRASISNKNITSIDFMLERILCTNTGFDKQATIPEIVKLNFPSKKTFSDILNKSEHLTCYDSFRKCLILLKFYHFWVPVLLNPNLIPHTDAFDVYSQETNALLALCGYEGLFAGNPYDWLFLWASTTEAPLTSLRNVVGSI